MLESLKFQRIVGAGVSKKIDMNKYQTLSEEQKAKILKVLEAQQAKEQPVLSDSELATETIEEFISIGDGQVRPWHEFLLLYQLL